MKKYLIPLLISIFFLVGIILPRDFGSHKEVIFRVEKDESVRKISVNLEKEGLIWRSHLFRVYAFFRGKAGNLQAGCYSLSPSMNINKIAGIIASGDVVKKMVAIPEGFTSAQILQRLNETRPISGLTPGVDEETPGVEAPEIGLVSSEGYLFPDTYEISYCMEQEKIIRLMKDNFDRKTAGLKITPEIVVMASLLEKELRIKEDKELASGILWKRLKVGMPLQVDAYMWTYENYGLPPKPIANPGLETILAALYPKESPYWYYLSTPGGKTIFSRTLEEHNIAKVKYLTGK